MKPHKHAEVLRAIADGRDVEYRASENLWVVMDRHTNPLDHPYYEWRIKPTPPIVVERCICLNDPVGIVIAHSTPFNVRFTFDPDTKMPIKVELI